MSQSDDHDPDTAEKPLEDQSPTLPINKGRLDGQFAIDQSRRLLRKHESGEILSQSLNTMLHLPYATATEGTSKLYSKRSSFASPLKQEMQMTMQRQFSKLPLKNSQLFKKPQKQKKNKKKRSGKDDSEEKSVRHSDFSQVKKLVSQMNQQQTSVTEEDERTEDGTREDHEVIKVDINDAINREKEPDVGETIKTAKSCDNEELKLEVEHY